MINLEIVVAKTKQLFSRSVVPYDFYTSKQVDTVFISLNLETIASALFGAETAILKFCLVSFSAKKAEYSFEKF